MKLTAATLDTLTLPPGVAEKKYFDERLPGHGVRLRHTSDRSKWRWITQVDINGRTQVQTHGPVTLLDPGAAFKRSKDLLASVRLGHDPAAEKRQARERAAETFGALLKRYLPYKQARVRPRSYKEIERHLEKYARPLHTRSISTLDRRAIAALKSAIAAKAGPTAADTMHGSISSYCTWLIREGLLEGANPASLINKAAQGKGRDRVLSLGEVCEIWDALPPSGDDYGDIVRLLFYILARKTEVGALQWDEVDFDTAEIRLPASRCKNNRPHVIPLAPAALAILEARRTTRAPDAVAVFGRSGQTGFSGWSFAKAELDQRIAEARKAAGIAEPMPPWVLHDIRRFGSTYLHDRLGTAPHIVEALLAHVSGFKVGTEHVGGFRTGVGAVYNKAAYLDERRRVLERWSRFIEEITIGKQPATVVKLHR